MDKRFKIFAACVIGALLILALVNLYFSQPSGEAKIKSISYSQFLDQLEQNQIRSVTMAGQQMVGVLTDNSAFRSFAANDADLVKQLRAKGVAITALAAPDSGPSWVGILTTILPMLLLVGLTIFFMRGGGGMGGGHASSMGKSRARLLNQAQGSVTFQDVAGVDEAREGLQEIVDFLRDPGKFQKLGGRIPRGVLLVGPPGSGKTLLARAIAGEAKVPFFSISGSDFVEMFVGIGASRVRAMFQEAKKSAPCIIFMDEIDAVGRHRGAGLGQGNDEREQTLNQLLVEMDGFQANEGVILIAATNRPDVLDPALIRPGRFDREIVVANPDVLGREQILKVHLRKVPAGGDVDLKAIARSTPGFSGAELMNLVNEAALLAVRRSKSVVGMAEFESAKDKVMMGEEQRTRVIGENERRLTAYREGGRAVIALHIPSADPVHKATIVPRGRTRGMVKQIGENEERSMTLEQMTSRLAILMGGRAAEEMTFGRQKVTSGAASDIEQATKLARQMVTRWGLSEALGTIAYEENQGEVFLGHSVARQQNISEHDAQKITAEIRALVDSALATARHILTRHREELEILAGGLLQYETLSGEEMKKLLRGEAPIRESHNAEIARPALAPLAAE